VSTEKQADHGVSLDVQREKVEAYARTYDLDLVAVVEDAGHSAKTLDRPGMARVLGILRSGEAEAMLVFKLDRLTRSVRDLDRLVHEFFVSDRCALLSVSDQIDTRSANGRMVLGILTQIAQWEREQIGERVSVAMRRLKSEGRFLGGPAPYGFRNADGGGLVDEPSEQRVIALVRDLRSAGTSLRQIVRELSDRGLASRRGTPFQLTQVARMLHGEGS
jgi:DNA invertase Pin-like site-specific DNA recombinase